MDDRRIEDVLRDSWQPMPPDGMRDRTLRLARKELARRQGGRRILGMGWWKIALPALGIMIVILTNVADSRLEERIDAMVCRQSTGGPEAQVAQMISPQEWQRRQSQILDRLYDKAGKDPL